MSRPQLFAYQGVEQHRVACLDVELRALVQSIVLLLAAQASLGRLWVSPSVRACARRWLERSYLRDSAAGSKESAEGREQELDDETGVRHHDVDGHSEGQRHPHGRIPGPGGVSEAPLSRAEASNQTPTGSNQSLDDLR